MEESAGDDEQINPEELTEQQRDKRKGGIAGTTQSTGNGSAGTANFHSSWHKTSPQKPKASTPVIPRKAQRVSAQLASNRRSVKPFVRAPLPITPPITSHISYATSACPACQLQHPRGACALKLAGAEHCGLCGLAHYGAGRVCPHINSETQVREMLETLKNSTEPKHLVETATKYLRGVKGHLVQKKKREREKALGIIVNVNGAMHGPATSASAQGHGSATIGADSAGQGVPNSRSLEDRAVESALLGYLGR